MSDYTFKVGLVGPSRIGKTTLVAALFEQARGLLQGLPVTLEAAPMTQRVLRKNHNAVQAAVAAGRFNPEALRGTEGAFRYELSFTLESETFNLHILDYPGAWLTESPEKWKAECERWIQESPVLLVPTDATLVREPQTAGQYVASRDALGLFEARDVMTKWAKAIRTSGQPALLAFVPLKTETYFDDNGGRRRDKDELLRRFDQTYGPLVQEAIKELGDHAPNVRIEYHPIDSLGCVDLQRMTWNGDAAPPVATFEVRRNHGYRPFGADDLLTSILRVPFERVRLSKDGRIAEAEGDLKRDRGLFGGFWYWVTGEQGRATDHVNGLKDQKAQLLSALEEISGRPRNPRIADLA